jgi:rhizosphere induced protein
LKPGVIFNAGENSPTGMAENNYITLTKEDGNYKFINRKDWHQQGVLCVMSDNTTAINQASIGIGLSGAVAFAAQAQPNMHFVFTPRLEYWVTFADVKQGQVLEPSELNALKIDFPYGIFSMNATFNADNSWTITPGLD